MSPTAGPKSSHGVRAGFPENLQLRRGTNGLLHWDGIMRGTLTAQIASYFGDFTYDTGAQVRRIPNAPWFIRVRFSSRNSNIRFYHDLSLFELRLPNTVNHPTGQRSTFYRCVAIVRLRDSPEGSDTVQLFRPDGVAFRPNGGAFPLSDDWRVHDGGNYVLYFLHTCTPPFPEELAWSQSIHHPFAANFHLLDTVGMDVLNDAIRKEATGGATPRLITDVSHATPDTGQSVNAPVVLPEAQPAVSSGGPQGAPMGIDSPGRDTVDPNAGNKDSSVSKTAPNAGENGAHNTINEFRPKKRARLNDFWEDMRVSQRASLVSSLDEFKWLPVLRRKPAKS